MTKICLQQKLNWAKIFILVVVKKNIISFHSENFFKVQKFLRVLKITYLRFGNFEGLQKFLHIKKIFEAKKIIFFFTKARQKTIAQFVFPLDSFLLLLSQI